MTREQAELLLAQLCDGLGRTPQSLRPGQIADVLDGLSELSHETGSMVVDYLIRTWTSNRFPGSAAIREAARNVGREGVANASAYSRVAPEQYDREQVRRALAAHARWEAMSAEEYMAELESLLPRIQGM